MAAIKQVERYNLKKGYTVLFFKSNPRLTLLHKKYLFDMLDVIKNYDIMITVITKILSRR